MRTVDLLTPILERKRRENVRRLAHAALYRGALDPGASAVFPSASAACDQLRRSGDPVPRVIAEIKLRSPSAGVIRPRERGAVVDLARQYREGGAAAVSVLCDGPGFGGSPLDLRRAAAAIDLPVLFKEFVLDSIQIALARAVGARFVLLLVRAMDAGRLGRLVDEAIAAGLAPVVEAADEREVELALATRATIVGVNARDLSTFRVDTARALAAIGLIPADRVAVHMSGIATGDDLRRVGQSRADAVLIGEALMRARSPGARLAELLAEAGAG